MDLHELEDCIQGHQVGYDMDMPLGYQTIGAAGDDILTYQQWSSLSDRTWGTNAGRPNPRKTYNSYLISQAWKAGLPTDLPDTEADWKRLSDETGFSVYELKNTVAPNNVLVWWNEILTRPPEKPAQSPIVDPKQQRTQGWWSNFLDNFWEEMEKDLSGSLKWLKYAAYAAGGFAIISLYLKLKKK